MIQYKLEDFTTNSKVDERHAFNFSQKDKKQNDILKKHFFRRLNANKNSVVLIIFSVTFFVVKLNKKCIYSLIQNT